MTTRLKTRPLEPKDFGPRDDTAFAWLGMAGVMVNARGTILLIDSLLCSHAQDGQLFSEIKHKLLIEIPIQADAVPRVDAVLYTHADPDHFARPTVEALEKRLKPLFVGPPPIANSLREFGVDPKRIRIVRDFDAFRIGGVEIRVTPALHDHREDRWFRGEACGYVMKTADGAIWHPGDSRLIDELRLVRGVDAVFFDVAAVDSHLGPFGSAHVARASGAKAMIAFHYGTYDLPAGSWANCDPEDARPLLKDHPARFLVPNPGELLRLPLAG